MYYIVRKLEKNWRNDPGNLDPCMEPLKARNGRHHRNNIVYAPNPLSTQHTSLTVPNIRQLRTEEVTGPRSHRLVNRRLGTRNMVS